MNSSQANINNKTNSSVDQQSFISGRTSIDSTSHSNNSSSVMSSSDNPFPTVSSVRKLANNNNVPTMQADSKVVAAGPGGALKASGAGAGSKAGISDDVDEDISAFYQAKEELLRRKARQPQ
jgi:hypothetical protein